MTDNVFLSFSEDSGFQALYQQKWKIMIVDDDPQVHKATKLVLDDFTFEKKALKFISAYSGLEAMEILKDNPDTAVILLDVVMEEEDSGFKVVKYAREILKNTSIRIILKTGQPGRAPEREVISRYDINDYREKTELTDDKFFTAMTAALRSYRDITALLKSRNGLEMIIKSTAGVAGLKSLNQLASGILMQLGAVLGAFGGSFFCMVKTMTGTQTGKVVTILAATGNYKAYVNHDAGDVVEETVFLDILKAYNLKTSIYTAKYSILYSSDKYGSEGLIYVERSGEPDTGEKELADSFCMNFSTAFDNIHLQSEMLGCLKEACVVINSIDKIVSFNRAFEKDFGFNTGMGDSDDSGLLIKYLEEYGEETLERDAIISAIRQCGVRIEGELAVGRIRKIPYSVTIQPLKDASGNSIGRIVIFYDITAYKLLHNELREKNRSMERLNTQQSKYMSVIEEMKTSLDSENKRMNLYLHKVSGKLVKAFKKIEEHVNVQRGSKCILQSAELFHRMWTCLDKEDVEIVNGSDIVGMQFDKLMECFEDAERFVAEQIQSNAPTFDTFLDATDIRILKLIAKGKSNKEIAGIINFEEGSVKNRIRDMIRNVIPDRQGDKRCLLVGYAYEKGLVEEYIFND